MNGVDRLKFDGSGLVPAVVQDVHTGDVLMLSLYAESPAIAPDDVQPAAQPVEAELRLTGRQLVVVAHEKVVPVGIGSTSESGCKTAIEGASDMPSIRSLARRSSSSRVRV